MPGLGSGQSRSARVLIGVVSAEPEKISIFLIFIIIVIFIGIIIIIIKIIIVQCRRPEQAGRQRWFLLLDFSLAVFLRAHTSVARPDVQGCHYDHLVMMMMILLKEMVNIRQNSLNHHQSHPKQQHWCDEQLLKYEDIYPKIRSSSKMYCLTGIEMGNFYGS